MDPELEAMQKVAEAVSALDDAARERVIAWAISRYGIATGLQGPASGPRVGIINDGVGVDSAFGEFADLFYAANPEAHGERALVAAYWLSLKNEGQAFQSQEVNALLKDLGFQVGNITDALSQNMREKPALIIQTRKSGSTRQARKTYKMTDAGIRRTKAMIERATSEKDSA